MRAGGCLAVAAQWQSTGMHTCSGVARSQTTPRHCTPDFDFVNVKMVVDGGPGFGICRLGSLPNNCGMHMLKGDFSVQNIKLACLVILHVASCKVKVTECYVAM